MMHKTRWGAEILTFEQAVEGLEWLRAEAIKELNQSMHPEGMETVSGLTVEKLYEIGITSLMLAQDFEGVLRSTASPVVYELAEEGEGGKS
jgi:hypothetical protein